jgi:hypothetical protein
VSIELVAINPRLDARLRELVEKLEAAVAAGMVPNVLFNEAKDIINRAVEESSEEFLASGPHVKGRNGEPHHQSDWWLDAYDADAFVRGAHGLPSALKRVQKAGNLKAYEEFLLKLMPLNALLASAKPLIKKKGELPPVRSAKQIADDADRMVCQCCGRKILANMGSIAHHGYERPGYGWQSASCSGAKELPFEASRDALGKMIVVLKGMQKRMKKARKDCADEASPIRREWRIGWHKDAEKGEFEFSRANFDSAEGQKAKSAIGHYGDFDDLLKIELANRDSALRSIASDIKMHQARYDGWKKSHQWKGGQWAAL